MIVMKFGGSSLESLEAVNRVVAIVKSFLDEAPVVVVSALGKTTDRLLKMGTLAAQGDMTHALRELNALESFHAEFSPLSEEMVCLFENIRLVLDRVASEHTLSPANWDALLSHGERLSSRVVTEALRVAGVRSLHLCAEKLIVTNELHTHAAPLVWETYARLRRAIPLERARQVAVMGGFIGSTEAGVPTTLGRGGSDFTASLVGAAINAAEVQIWTDVDGMLSCDPRVTKGGRCLRNISYAEAAEMAEWGAKVLHPATVAPAMRQRVPVSIRNSRNPGHCGTRIEGVQVARHEGLVKSIACLKDVTLLRIAPHARVLTAQFRELVQFIFARHDATFHPMNGKSAVEVAVSECESLPALVEELSAIGTVQTETGLAAVSLIGRGIEGDSGLMTHAVKAFAARSIAFHARATAAMRVTFLVAAQEVEIASNALHDAFVKFQENGPFYREFELERARFVAKEPASRPDRNYSPARFPEFATDAVRQ
jgi:aspartate kinase